MANSNNVARAAAQKMETGSLMTLEEVAVRLSVSPMTVHRMQLSSIRLGRSLRFDPTDVRKLIANCKEPKSAPSDPSVADQRAAIEIT